MLFSSVLYCFLNFFITFLRFPSLFPCILFTAFVFYFISLFPSNELFVVFSRCAFLSLLSLYLFLSSSAFLRLAAGSCGKLDDEAASLILVQAITTLFVVVPQVESCSAWHAPRRQAPTLGARSRASSMNRWALLRSLESWNNNDIVVSCLLLLFVACLVCLPIWQANRYFSKQLSKILRRFRFMCCTAIDHRRY